LEGSVKSIRIEKPLFVVNNKIVLAILFLLCCIVFYPVFSADFINWDDFDYVVNNPYITSISINNIVQLLTEYRSGNYHPISVLSYLLDYSINGLNPFVFHAINLIFHFINGFLVYVLITKLFKDKVFGFIIAILFVINPLQVETVAWVAERKNLLYALFFFLSLIYYVSFIEKQQKKFLLLSLLFFVLSCLSKATAVTLVPILFCIDYLFKRKLFSRVILLEKLPFLFIAFVIGIIAIVAQKQSESINFENSITFLERIIIAGNSLIMYVTKLLIPLKLSAMYPYPAHDKIPPLYNVMIVVCMAATFLLIRYRKKIPKIYVFGTLFYFFNIAIVLQLLPVGRFTMADRYMYVASIGIYIVVVAALKKLYEKNRLVLSSIFVYATALCILTYNQTEVWKNDIILWTNVIDNYPKVEEAYDYRADAYSKVGKYNETIRDYDKLIALIPNREVAFNNRAIYKQKIKDYYGAIDDYNRAVELKPDYVEAYWGRAIALRDIKEYKESIEDFNWVEKFNPNYKDLWYQKGYTKLMAGYVQKALSDFDEAIKHGGNLPLIYNNKAIAYHFLKNYEEAIQNLTMAIKLKPDYGEAYFNRAFVYFSKTDTLKACDDFNKALAVGYEKSRPYTQKFCK
jgi:tetratricopeptide (TPR) repeat protein